jgi:hypothetical protein
MNNFRSILFGTVISASLGAHIEFEMKENEAYANLSTEQKSLRMESHANYYTAVGNQILGTDNPDYEIDLITNTILGETYFAIQSTVGVPG